MRQDEDQMIDWVAKASYNLLLDLPSIIGSYNVFFDPQSIIRYRIYSHILFVDSPKYS